MTFLWIFLCTYLFLYTAGMCYVHTSIKHLFTWQMFSVRAVQWYNLPRAITSQRYSLCRLVTQVHMRMPFLEAVPYAQTKSTLPSEIQPASCLLVQRTHVTPPLFSFGRPMLWMLYFHSTELGRSWTWSAPWNATSSHIFLLRMDNQFANENFTEIFVRHFATTWLMYKKCV